MDDALELPIGEVARRAGVAASTIRYYESIGLLPLPGRLHGKRRYSTEVLGTLAFIGVAQNAGFKLEEIKEFVQAGGDRDGFGDQMRELSTHKLDEIDALLARARTMKRWLQAAQGCDCASPADCTLFPQDGELADDAAFELRVVISGGGCRRR